MKSISYTLAKCDEADGWTNQEVLRLIVELPVFGADYFALQRKGGGRGERADPRYAFPCNFHVHDGDTPNAGSFTGRGTTRKTRGRVETNGRGAKTTYKTLTLTSF